MSDRHGTPTMLLVLGAISASCGGDSGNQAPTPAAPVATTIVVAPATDSMVSLGDTRTFIATVRDAAGAPMPSVAVTWTVLPLSVVTLAANGHSATVTAIAPGSATLTATAVGSAVLHTVASVAVRQKLASFSLTPASAQLVAGSTVTLQTSATDARGSPVAGLAAPSFATSDATRASVSTSGVVTGVGAGTATITATQPSVDGSRTATAMMTVAATPSSSAGYCDAAMPLGMNASLGNTRLYPTDDDFNVDVSQAPVDPASSTFINTIGPTQTLHQNIGYLYNGLPVAYPYIVVSGAQPKVPVSFAFPL